jgi:exonuclease III
MKIVYWNINGVRSNIVSTGTLKKKFIYNELQESNLKQLMDY